MVERKWEMNKKWAMLCRICWNCISQKIQKVVENKLSLFYKIIRYFRFCFRDPRHWITYLITLMIILNARSIQILDKIIAKKFWIHSILKLQNQNLLEQNNVGMSSWSISTTLSTLIRLFLQMFIKLFKMNLNFWN